ncbi:MAG: S16 family serine protease [Acidimicrobiales bacterium]
MSLVGPPGVGRPRWVNRSPPPSSREFVRVALGGIRDEAEIRGHRRTYVGARPGRIVRALQEAGAMNPVILLDEIDKVGSGWQGEPSAALLEVLDPAQNNSFRDHYLEFELDLSDVIFIATANTLDTIPGPLLDRLEVISVEGYTEREKTEIAKTHLIPKLVVQNGLAPDEVVITDDALTSIVANYTREAGVRRLERRIDKVFRKSATRIAAGADALTVTTDDLHDLLGKGIPKDEARRIDRPGIVTGLAVTGAGGDVLMVEAALVPGKGTPIITGQLGDVMKESATIAQSVVAASGRKVPKGYRLHIHFPAGAVPKDGPSAGIALVTAITSLLDDTLVRPSVAMTGEVTLHGKVLPIGGVKQKVLAAHRSGIKDVLLPQANGRDIDDLPDDVLAELTIHLVASVDEVLALALT